jgi:hypothetical protein
LIHSMRLSLTQGVHADPSSTAWQEIGVKPSVSCPACPAYLGLPWSLPWGLSGITNLNPTGSLGRENIRKQYKSGNSYKWISLYQSQHLLHLSRCHLRRHRARRPD